MSSVRMGLVGAGSMALNHARVIAESNRANLEVVVDVDENRAAKLASRYGARASARLDTTFDLDAVVVASSNETHYEIALCLLREGVPMLIEKPLAAELEQVIGICRTAAQSRIPLMCGFVERFNPVVTTVNDLLAEDPIHIVSMRHSPPTPRMTQSVVHDLLIHDIDLAARFCGDSAVDKVFGVQWPASEQTAEVVDCSVHFSIGTIATMSASRMSQRKIRTNQIFTGTVLYDLDLLRSNLTVYRNVTQSAPDPMTYRAETIVDIPFVRHSGEPLALQLEHFLNLVTGEEDVFAEIKTLVKPHLIAHWVDAENRGIRFEVPAELQAS